MATITVPSDSTLPVAGAEIKAAPLKDWITNIRTFLEATNIDEANVDTSGSDGIVGKSIAQTITGLKTFSTTSAAAGGLREVAKFEINPSSGTPANNDGLRLTFTADDAGGAATAIGYVDLKMTDASASSEDSEWRFSTIANASSVTPLVVNSTAITMTTTTVAIGTNATIGGGLTVTGTGVFGALTVGSAAISEAELEMLDGITAGTAAASKAVVLDASKNIATIGTIGSGAITSSGVVTATGFTIGSAVITEAELEILDGATVTTAELNLIDGGTSRGTTAVASGDGLLVNDAGTMRMTNVDTVSTYFASHSVGGTNIATVGTIGTGTWQGTAVASAYLDADTAHLSTTQTFTGDKTFTGTVTVGVDGTGKDVIFYGDTASSSLTWDESADDLVFANAGIAINGSTDATGDLYYRDSSGFLARLASGADGYVLTGTGAGAVPAWEASGVGGGISFSGSTADGMVTYGSSSSAIVASTLTFASDILTATSTSANLPKIELKNTHAGATAGIIQFSKDSASGDDSDVMGTISFYGTDAGEATHEEFAKIEGIVETATAGQEGGQIKFSVASHDAELNQGLLIEDGSAEDEVDVTIGNGSASIVTIPGHIDLAGNIDVDGTLEADAITIGDTAIGSIYGPIAGSSSIATVGTIGTGTWQGTKVASAYLDDDTAHLGVVQTFTANKTFTGTVTVGVDGTGKDVKFFGDSAGAYMEWDESADQLRIMGASADATTSTGKLLLATSLTDINANDVLGKIDFQAPHETGTDAIAVAASIQAVAQSTFSASSNATDIIFYTGHSEAATEKFRFTSQGEIGIGGANYGSDGQVLTSAGANLPPAWEALPSSGISFNGSTANGVATYASSSVADVEANLTFDGSTLAVTGSMTLSSTSTISGDMTFVDNAKVTLGTGGDADLYYDNSNAILLPAVSGSGGFLINTTARTNNSGVSAAKLDLATTAWPSAIMTLYSADTNPCSLILQKSRSATVGTLAYPESGDGLGQIGFAGAWPDNGYFYYGAEFKAFAAADWSDDNLPTYLAFRTVPAGAYSSVERMRINASASPAITVTGTAGLSTGTAWTDTSDSRIKTSVQTISGALAKINSLRPVSFRYTDQYLSAHDEIDGTKTYNSFIAEEYATVFPDAVSVGGDLVKTTPAVLYRAGDNDIPNDKAVGDVRTEEISETLMTDLKTYTPHDLHMYLVAAVQELSAKVTVLEAA